MNFFAGPRLDLTQSLRQTLSPRLHQAIRVLGMSEDEAQAFAEAEAQRNPLLRVRRGSAGRTPISEIIEATARQPVSLRDHLFEQLARAAPETELRAATARLIEDIDEDGYLRREEGEETDPVALALLHSFEPAGVGARDLRECLSLQMRETGEARAAMQVLLDHLSLIATRRYGPLARKCGVDQAGLAQMLQRLRALDPRPGRGFAPTAPVALEPDVIVEAGPDGEWRVRLNREDAVVLSVDDSYVDELSRVALGDEETGYLAERLESARWLVEVFAQRGATLLRVACEAVRRQDEFLTRGRAHLAPLTMRALAERLNMHESSVSRAVANKTVLTPQGVMPLRGLFSAAAPVGEDAAPRSVVSLREEIRHAISDEPGDAFYTDHDVAEQLAKQGFEVARRTVAKHREAMRIPSAAERRREQVFRDAASAGL